ncbi:hypothetical protein OUZ56_007818 [Daphnia magna]|uniref:Uncharacterized protein n=1 Tax=Daphnia magna TaxID=35525 RepID=A0ABR0AB32_9CRUS|nr:hypothetical protein OUZ56_007818 [Daphnia magna]
MAERLGPCVAYGDHFLSRITTPTQEIADGIGTTEATTPKVNSQPDSAHCCHKLLLYQLGL